MEELLEALTDMGTHYTPEVKENTKVTPHSSPVHHRHTDLGSEELELKEHSAGLAVSDSETNRHTLHTSQDHASASDQLAAITHTDMVELQEELESIGKESHSPESLPTVPEHLDIIHEDHHLAGPTRVMPLEAASHVDPHPIDLTSDLTQIQRENLENFATGTIENTETTIDAFSVTEEYQEVSQEEIENLNNECQEGEVERGGADCLATVGASSVAQVGLLGSAAACVHCVGSVLVLCPGENGTEMCSEKFC